MAYQVHLKQFDGPLDLLLHLIEQAEVDIKDIFISEITTQYLAYMAQVDELDMDTASEFLTMAATLVYIKSRSLLPRPPKEEEEGEDPAETLIRQLREYKAIKLAGQRLQELEQAARGMYTKLPEEFLLPPQEVVWEGGTREGPRKMPYRIRRCERTPLPYVPSWASCATCCGRNPKWSFGSYFRQTPASWK